jgi:hypothetical protein
VSEVAAVVIGPRTECTAAVRGERVEEVVRAASLAELAEAARRTDALRLWLVDSGSTPSADALDALLDESYDPVASLPVDSRGAPDEAALGRFTESDVPAVLDAVGARRVPLRHTHVTSLLIERDAVLGERPPDPRRFGRYAGSEWTARLFARRPAMLVPRSRVRTGARAAGSPAHAVRMLRSGVWGRGETLRELHRILRAG